MHLRKEVEIAQIHYNRIPTSKFLKNFITGNHGLLYLITVP